MPSYFAETSDADAIAATLPTTLLGSYLALTDPVAKAALLLQASIDVDRAMRYQGRRYDTVNQTLEFPRVAYEPSNAILPNVGAQPIGGWGFGSTVWDIDPTTQLPIVPDNILQAVVWQANFLATAGSGDRMDDQYSGLKDQGVGSLRESYDRANHAVETGLCRRAFQLVERYRLRTGRLM